MSSRVVCVFVVYGGAFVVFYYIYLRVCTGIIIEAVVFGKNSRAGVGRGWELGCRGRV